MSAVTLDAPPQLGTDPPRSTTAVPPRWASPLLVAVGAGLRLWRAAANGFSFDESFTALAGRRPFGNLLDYLARADSHPPLDYLMRSPLARAGSSDFVMRLPSVAFSIGALALFAWWMRARGWTGVIATALVSVSTFQVMYGGEARMYALLELLGIAMAMTAEAWLRRPARWHAYAVAGLVLLSSWDHASALLLVVGLVVLAGARVDRAAWRWRVAVVAGLVPWLVLWAPVLVGQRDAGHAGWIPPTSLGGFLEVVGRHLTFARSVGLAVLLAAVAGAVVLVRADRILGRTWSALGALPFALAALIGAFTPFLFDRSLTLSAWAVPLAVAFLVGASVERSRTLGSAVAVLVVVVALGSTVVLVRRTTEYDRSADHLAAVTQPGDVVATRPVRYGLFTQWRLDLGPRVAVEGLPPNTVSRRVGNAAPTGRIWVLTPIRDDDRFAGFHRCAPRWTDGIKKVLCLRGD